MARVMTFTGAMRVVGWEEELAEKTVVGDSWRPAG